MSIAGLQKTQQLLNVIGQQLPSIAQASEKPREPLNDFLIGALSRSGVQISQEMISFVGALAALIGPPTELPQSAPLVPRQDAGA